MLERRLSLRHLLFAGACVALACAEAENTNPDEGSGGTGGSATSGSGGKGGTLPNGGKSGSGSGGSSGKGGAGGKGGSAGTTSTGGSSGSSSSGGSGGTPTVPPIGCLDTGAGGEGGAGTAGEGGVSGAAGDSAGGTSGSAGTAGSGGTPGAGGDGASGAAGAPGASPPLFFDDFEMGNAAAWTPDTHWSVMADGTNVYAGVGEGTPLFLSMVTDSCWADQIVEARIKIIAFPGMSTGYFAAVFARVVGNNGYFAAIDSSSSTKFSVRRLINGNIEKLGTEQTVQITRGTWYDIKFEVIGTMLRATFTDNASTKVITQTDSRIASGGVGVGVKNGDANFDDVRVTAP